MIYKLFLFYFCIEFFIKPIGGKIFFFIKGNKDGFIEALLAIFFGIGIFFIQNNNISYIVPIICPIIYFSRFYLFRIIKIKNLLHLFLLWHGSVIITFAFLGYIGGFWHLNWLEMLQKINWKFLLSLVFLTFPMGQLIKLLILRWTPEEGIFGYIDAGKYIGICERLLIFTFIYVGHWEAVGFLLTAKSVFRFGDIKEAKQLHMTEYILIGTLLSFGGAIFIGIINAQ